MKGDIIMQHKFISKKYWNKAWTIMSDKADEAAPDIEIINLSIGAPDIITPKSIIDKAMEDAVNGHTKYTDSMGDPELIGELIKFYDEEYNFRFSANEIITLAGGCHALYVALQAVLDPSDEVIINEPYFMPYKEQINQAGGKEIILKTLEKDGFSINIDKLKALITEKTKAIILNSPNNPTGAFYNKEQLQKIAEVAIENDLLVISDEVYSDFCFYDKFTPIATLDGMKERTITIGSFSKGFAMTGWRIGYIIAPDFIVNCIKNINDNICYCAPSVSQRAALHALKQRDAVKPQIIEKFKERMFYSYERINKIPLLSVTEPKGGMYLFANIKKTGMDSNEFTKMLAKECQIIVIPGNVFGESGEGYVRIACTVGIDKLGEAFDRIEKFLAGIGEK